ncbi:MAG: peptide deformylase [Bacteroidetes bacterium]|nr:peptide deformylase [Bacteroidota bacterium]
MLPVYLIGNPILRRKSYDIPMDFPNLKVLIDDMFETMYAAEGVGLAAPQVGFNIRLFVIDSHPFVESYPELVPLKKVFINPRIEEEYGELFAFTEGCLSVPEIHEEVIRKSNIKITYQDEKGDQHTEHFSGINARVIQHEYDHLEGKLFTDKVSTIKKMILKKKLTDITNGKVKPRYKSKI